MFELHAFFFFFSHFVLTISGAAGVATLRMVAGGAASEAEGAEAAPVADGKAPASEGPSMYDQCLVI